MICTTIEQSKRLLELGINPDSADMCYAHANNLYTYPYKEVKYWENIFNIRPAWSFYRLIEMVGSANCLFEEKIEDYYDVLINIIEREIKNGVFNKKYMI